MKKIIVILLACMMLAGCADTSSYQSETSTYENMKLAWGMYESQVREIESIPEECQTTEFSNFSWIKYNDREVLNCIGELGYHFDNSKLSSIDFIPGQINNVDEMNKIYDTLKENVSLEYGNPDIDEIRENQNNGLQYHYTEWNTENTLIMLQDI